MKNIFKFIILTLRIEPFRKFENEIFWPIKLGRAFQISGKLLPYKIVKKYFFVNGIFCGATRDSATWAIYELEYLRKLKGIEVRFSSAVQKVWFAPYDERRKTFFESTGLRRFSGEQNFFETFFSFFILRLEVLTKISKFVRVRKTFYREPFVCTLPGWRIKYEIRAGDMGSQVIHAGQ